ncbi:peptidoglycan-binding domain-containing protein [Jiangella sp. DSM 45060]|uniref:peptidoglycan-binding domain-containing protein n=1 Tax=Jiangella sp. DSM 45060 TaxID=1798224 RepID=UPI00087A86D0|nr:peptidoglycan-binding domain-containing protein [Jiangella sp. DSM 45060]SDT43210.1 Putative peptidoglycan binding domain-containing protein [Jiangella sp. DSM 45060]
MRARRVVVPLGVAAVLAAGALAARGIGGGAGPGGDEPDGLPPATATVSTTDLVQTVQVPGVLGYGTPVELPAKSDGGTLTWVAAPGAVVGQGQPVYAVDGEPVVLVHGTVPPYRTLEPGVAGPDVQQLEAALAALGYGGFQVDDEYHGSTADAVARWQDDLGVEETGTVTTGQIVVAPADLRIAEQTLAAGATLGGPEGGGAASVVTYTGTTPVVVVALDPAQQHLVAPGTAATVLLPDGATTAATVSAVSPVATAADTDDADTSTATIGVTVALADPAVAGALDAAPVDVGLVAAEAQDVLAVPVGALVALAEGGYAVQVVDGGQAAFVPVETGMFASGLVEVSGAGIEDGTVVGVPA